MMGRPSSAVPQHTVDEERNRCPASPNGSRGREIRGSTRMTWTSSTNTALSHGSGTTDGRRRGVSGELLGLVADWHRRRAKRRAMAAYEAQRHQEQTEGLANRRRPPSPEGDGGRCLWVRTHRKPTGDGPAQASTWASRRAGARPPSDADGAGAGLAGVRGAGTDGVGAGAVGGPQLERERAAAAVGRAASREDLVAVVADPHRPGLTRPVAVDLEPTSRRPSSCSAFSFQSALPLHEPDLMTRAPPPPDASAAGARRAPPLNAAAVTVTTATVRRRFMAVPVSWPIFAGRAFLGRDNSAGSGVTVARWPVLSTHRAPVTRRTTTRVRWGRRRPRWRPRGKGHERGLGQHAHATSSDSRPKRLCRTFVPAARDRPEAGIG